MWLNSWHARPDRRRVDDGQELLEVLGEQPVEERRVAVLERGQPDVLLERVVLDPEVLELELDLLLDREHPVRQQPAQPERVALVVREGEVLGQQPAAEERRPGEPDRGRAAGRDVVVRVGQAAHPREDSGGGAGPGRGVGAGRPARPSPPVIVTVPTIPYASWPGRWQMYCCDPAAANVTSSSPCRPAGIVTSVGRAPWTGSVPVRWRSWTAASPTIHSWSIGSVLRMHERDRHAEPARSPRSA